MDAETLSPAEQRQLVSEVADLRVVLRVMLAVVLAGISYFSIGIFFAIPRFEKLFEDMMPARNLMPGVSKLVIGWSHLGFIPLIVLIGLAAVGMVLLATQRNIRAAGFGFVLTAVPLLLHLLVCWSGISGGISVVLRALTDTSGL